MPLVSIVLPTLNRADLILEAVGSAIGQTFTDWEMIIVDDGSTDNTDRVLSTISDPRIRILALPRNSGESAARNAGSRLATGTYIAVLDSDDIWMPNHLAAVVSKLERDTDLSVCGAQAYMINSSGRSNPFLVPTGQDEVGYRLLLQCTFVHASVVMRRAAFEAVGGYDESVSKHADLDLWLRLREAGHKMTNLSSFDVILRETSTSILRGPGELASVGLNMRMHGTALSRATGCQLDDCIRVAYAAHGMVQPGDNSGCFRVINRLKELYPGRQLTYKTEARIMASRFGRTVGKAMTGLDRLFTKRGENRRRKRFLEGG